jgi:phage protein D
VEITPDRKSKHLAWLTGAKAPFDAQRVFGKVANPPPKGKAPAGDTARAEIISGETKKKTAKNPRSNTVRARAQAAREAAESYFHIRGAHHANASARRRKTPAELIEGHELHELYDRRFPGRLAARRAI